MTDLSKIQAAGIAAREAAATEGLELSVSGPFTPQQLRDTSGVLAVMQGAVRLGEVDRRFVGTAIEQLAWAADALARRVELVDPSAHEGEEIRNLKMQIESLTGARDAAVETLVRVESGLQAELRTVLSERDKLQQFKQYVHGRLDKMGVPADDESSPHSAQGCRIGARLDYLQVVFDEAGNAAFAHPGVAIISGASTYEHLRDHLQQVGLTVKIVPITAAE